MSRIALRWFVVLGSLVVAIAALQYLSNPLFSHTHAPDINYQLMSVSYSPPDGDRSTADQKDQLRRIDDDLANIARYARHIRTYSVSGSSALIPALAYRHGLSVSLGLWIDYHRPAATRIEVESGIAVARRWPNVTEIYVGNESLLRRDATSAELIKIMRYVKQRTGKPVSTGETWDLWIKHPELARASDFIGAHILPYWEGVSATDAVPTALGRYRMLTKEFPDKRVVISEFGWPSGRLNHFAATASTLNQAVVLRKFVHEVHTLGIHYNIVEALDQPWKVQEGDVGQFWGMLDARGKSKFAWQGQPIADSNWLLRLVIGIVVGLVGQVTFAKLERATIPQLAMSGIISQTFGLVIANVALSPLGYYLTSGYIVAWLIFSPLIAILAITSADRLRELSQFTLGSFPNDNAGTAPDRCDLSVNKFVSIHMPICNESFDVVASSLHAMADLDYSKMEVIVIVNNCSSGELFRLVALLCEALGPRFRTIDLGKIDGFKAGALNAGLRLTSPLADVIAIVDADYIVRPAWLTSTVPAFADARVGLVQAPQDHRNLGQRWINHAMNTEYGTFFDVGMVQRSAHNAIIAHGTMILIRRSALEQVGGWDEACICEDTELGLRLILAGWHARYTPVRFGAGLLPMDLPGYRTQRQRWAFGAMHIFSKHGRALISSKSNLTFQQRYHFLVGWLHWVADGIGLALALLNIIWAVAMLGYGYGSPPPAAMSYAILGAASVSLAHGVIIGAARPGVSISNAIGAVICAMTLQMPIARAMILVTIGHAYPFIVTAKGKRNSARVQRLAGDIWPDVVLATALLAAATMLQTSNRFQVVDITLFAGVMATQSLPFLSTLLVGLLTIWLKPQSLAISSSKIVLSEC